MGLLRFMGQRAAATLLLLIGISIVPLLLFKPYRVTMWTSGCPKQRRKLVCPGWSWNRKRLYCELNLVWTSQLLSNIGVGFLAS